MPKPAQASPRELAGPRRELVGYGRRCPKVRWPDGAKLALNIVVNYEEGSEHYVAAGDPRNDGMAEVDYRMDGDQRDMAAESVYEYGSRAGIWRLLRLFDEYGVRVTFFACGYALELNPDVGLAIREAGHEPCAHGWRWSEPWHFSRDEEAEEIRRAIDSIERTCGERPLGWYSRYSATVHTRDLLIADGGFLYDSNAYNDDLPYFTQDHGRSLLIVPYSQTNNDFRFIASSGGYGSPADFSDYCCGAIDELRREGEQGFPKMMSIGLHPRWIGQPGRIAALRRVIEHALAPGDVWLTRRCDIARWWIENSGDFE